MAIAPGDTFYWVRPGYAGRPKFRVDVLFCQQADDGLVSGRPANLGPGLPTARYGPAECEDADGNPLFPEEAHGPETTGR
jgi:hypothetical protein